MKGILGDMFDFNGNGNLEPEEQAMEFMFLQQELDEMNKQTENDEFDTDDDNSDIF